MAEEKPKETLQEAWVGKLNMGIMEPVMQFRIVHRISGGKGDSGRKKGFRRSGGERRNSGLLRQRYGGTDRL